MTTTIQSKPWDFSHVLDLVNSLSSNPSDSTPRGGKEDGGDETPRAKITPRRSSVKQREFDGIAQQDFAQRSPASRYVPETAEHSEDGGVNVLGDFAKVWQYLGTPAHLPTPTPGEPLSSQDTEVPDYPSKDDYASDGATYFKLSTGRPKTVQWQDQDSIGEQTTDAVSDSSIVPDSPTLTKSQRKKKNRKEKKVKERAAGPEQAAKKANVSESEADVVAKNTPARKASAHVVSSEPKKRHYALRERDAHGNAVTSMGADPLIEAANLAAQRVAAAKQADSAAPRGQPATPSKEDQTRKKMAGPRNQHPSATKPAEQSIMLTSQGPTNKQPQQWPPTTPKATATRFTPSTVQPQQPKAEPSLSSSQVPKIQQPQQNTVPSKPSRVIEPMTVRSGEDRHWAFFIKLINDFSEDRKHLINPMNLTNHNHDPKGLHVFVDASNIFIGFNDQLKRSRGIPDYFKMPQANLSFDALALLMERRRPIAKRVLVGSTPHMQAFDKAKQVGYECSILEKVYKARELTERQIYFKEHDRFGVRKRAKVQPANDSSAVNIVGDDQALGGGNGSGSETNAPQYAPARMIEQGVDEILHLKMLESVIDTDEPSTIVLATGDAAQAEYSQGFMAMVERALRKGWRVELVSWGKNINGLYKRRDWAERWGERFRIVTLDAYAEELLDM